ncbi:NAD-dependent epimerase/dehydratase family protein [Pontibacter roseus]|uniref:NAD-dependent epimerase/dehydratase family protein n=1 Tax=Pontibacter roseus TaxID=336989 RepID=UPI00037C9405|nr:NAD-dependent epimerase/dehydratase family protein [Pontibacter roseus]
MEGAKYVLVTGSAGFTGHHLVQALQLLGHHVLGLDTINGYYDPELKYARLALQDFGRSSIGPHTLARGVHAPALSFNQLDSTDKASCYAT